MQFRNLSLAVVGVGLVASAFALLPGRDDEGPTVRFREASLYSSILVIAPAPETHSSRGDLDPDAAGARDPARVQHRGHGHRPRIKPRTA